MFDLDGVLIDTEGIYSDFWSEMDRLYPTGTENFASVIKGSTLPVILDTYFPDPQHREAVCQHLDSQERNMKYRIFDGVVELLQALREQSVKTAIVTSSNRAKLSHLFNQHPALEALVDTIITDEDVTESKPSPQPYLIAASRLGVDIQACAVVEDSLAGMESGRRAGAAVVGVATTCTPETVARASHSSVNAFQDISINFLDNSIVLKR